MRLNERINRYADRLSDSDHSIWRFISNHRDSARRMSISGLSKTCAVSAASVVRFCKKIGLDGFGELKTVLKMEAEDIEPPRYQDTLNSLGRFYDNTWRELMRRDYTHASRLMRGARHIFGYASGYVQQNVMQELRRLFFYDNVFVIEIAGREEFRSAYRQATPEDLFLFISLSGETEHVKEFSQQLNLKGVPILSITEMQHNTLASRSTESLYVMPAQFDLAQDGDRPPFKSMIAYFLLLEIWYVHYRFLCQNEDVDFSRLRMKNFS